MQISSRRFLAALLPAVALTFAGFSAQAQNYYTTNFSNVETGTSTTGYTPAAYANGGATSATDPIVGQNGWASNDGTLTAGTRGTSLQLVGNSNFVGPYGQYFGSTFSAVLGGAYRTPAPSAGSPDVVPSATNAAAGIVSLYHPVSYTPGAAFSLNVDFVITLPGIAGFTARDAFAFTLGNATTNLLTINFTQATTIGDPATQDTLTLTTGANNLGQGGVTTQTNNGIVLNGQYHLTLTVTNPLTGAFTLTLAGAGNSITTTGTAGPFTAATFTQAGVLWNLQNKTATNGAYQGAGDNVLAFDNFTLAIPEPSTYAAVLAAGAACLAWSMRLRRKQA